MRHTQRLQTGMALAGLLLCLTSATYTWESSQHQSVSTGAMPAQTLSTLLHNDFTQDGSVEVFGGSVPHRQPLAVLRHRDQDFGALASVINDAVIVQKNERATYLLVFYKRDGQYDCTLAVTPSWCLVDPQHHISYQPDSTLAEIMKRHLA